MARSSLLFLFSFFPLAAGIFPSVYQIKTGYEALSDVQFIDSLHGWACGSNSTLLYTVNGGATWNQGAVQSTANWVFDRVYFVSPAKGFAVGGIGLIEADTCNSTLDYASSAHKRGAIFRTLDSGRTWQEVSVAAQYPIDFDRPTAWLQGLYFYDNLHGWACGAWGNLFRTVDGGDTWEQLAYDALNAWVEDGYGISFYGLAFTDANTGYMVGEDSVIKKTVDGGVTWSYQKGASLLSIPYSSPISVNTRRQFNYFRDVFFVNAQTGWAAGDNGCLLKTANGGAAWALQAINLPNTLHDLLDIRHLYFLNADTGWAVTHLSGGILRTLDGGAHWEWMKTGINGWFNAVYFSGFRHGWAVGEAGQIMHSTDGGATWVLQRGLASNGGSLAPILVIHAHGDDEVIWGTGSLGALYAFQKGLPVVTLRATFDDSRPLRRHGEPKKLELRSAHTVIGFCGQTTLDEFDTYNDSTHAKQIVLWGGSEDIMERQMVEAIRTWKPAVVVTHDSAYGEYNSQNHKSVSILATKAFHAAGNAAIYPELIADAGLSVWNPQKLYYMDTLPPAPYFQMNIGDTVHASGHTLADHAWRALNNYQSQSPPMYQNQTLTFNRFKRVFSSVTTTSIENDMLAGTNIAVKAEAPVFSGQTAPALRCFPNPFRSSITIALGGSPGVEPVTLKIYDIKGVLHEEIKVAANRLRQGIIWHSARCPQGMYVVKAMAGKQSFIQKILLVK